MWTVDLRRAADPKGLRYPSDLIDAEWTLVEPLIRPAERGGPKRSVDVREVPTGISYVLSIGCQWPAPPNDLSPKSTVYNDFDLWKWESMLERTYHALDIGNPANTLLSLSVRTGMLPGACVRRLVQASWRAVEAVVLSCHATWRERDEHRDH